MSTLSPLNLKLRSDYVLIKPVANTTSIDLVRQESDKPEIGEVVSVAEHTTNIKVGDTVFFYKYAAVNMRDTESNLTYLLVRDDDIVGIFSQE